MKRSVATLMHKSKNCLARATGERSVGMSMVAASSASLYSCNRSGSNMMRVLSILGISTGSSMLMYVVRRLWSKPCSSEVIVDVCEQIASEFMCEEMRMWSGEVHVVELLKVLYSRVGLQ